MKIYLVSLGAGVLVGIIYALMQVRSPAPPAAWFQQECTPKITGVEPPRKDERA
jgi:xanthosine utilization system XapX-like protein